MKKYTCEKCKTNFLGSGKINARFCSVTCRTVALNPVLYQYRCYTCGAEPGEPCRNDDDKPKRICYSRRHAKKKNCGICSSEFIGSTLKKYCSGDCCDAARRNSTKKYIQRMKDEAPSSDVRLKNKRKCIVCDAEFMSYNAKYCSNKCKRKKILENQRKERAKYKINVSCAVCKKEFIKCNDRRKFCSKDCSKQHFKNKKQKKKYIYE